LSFGNGASFRIVGWPSIYSIWHGCGGKRRRIVISVSSVGVG